MTTRPGSPTLVLVPTQVELRRIEDHGGFEPGTAIVALCGFGPVAAASRSAELIASLRPARIVLLGICGTFEPERLPIGAATEFDAVAIDGIGAGEGAELLGPAALGFPQWPGSKERGPEPIHDRIVLGSRAFAAHAHAARMNLLLTTCAASDTEAQAAVRKRRFPAAIAEDMEGFAVAFSCALAGVPLRIVRGVSNKVGDRDPARWRIPAALAAARTLALDVLRASEREA